MPSVLELLVYQSGNASVYEMVGMSKFAVDGVGALDVGRDEGTLGAASATQSNSTCC